MAACIAEDDLLDLAQGGRPLGDAPALEAHLADCPACSALLCSLIAARRDDEVRGALAGRALGPYRLDALIGAGAMGEVYRGRDLRLQRPVAVKVLARALAGSARRLEAEGRAAAAIAHPNVVTVYDAGTEDGVPYVVSELISGETLRSAIDRGPPARAAALALGVQLARGLAAAHAQGVVHRDLKPQNLIVTDDGTLKILDFGLAKLRGDHDVEATEPGTVLGTSGYLSPEQARGEPADARSDLFAAGAILYGFLTGRRAFDGATFAERLSAVLRDTPPLIDDPAGPIVARCLDKDPRKRFQSAGDLAWTLESIARGDPPASPRVAQSRGVSRRTFVLGATAAGLGGVVLGRALSPSRPPPRRAFVPAYEQLTYRQGRVASARFTRDGGSILYAAAWDDRPPAIYTARLGGGGTRPLELPPAELLAVSSRGQLALALDPRFIEGFHHRGQLALAPLEGGEPRGLGVDVQDADFSPDGTELAIVREAGGRFRLEWPIGRVLLEAGWLSHPRISPDGALIACLVHDQPRDNRGDVVVVPRGGGPARTIAADWSTVDGVVWSPRGRTLWVSASKDGGNNAVWAIALDGRTLAQVQSAGRLRVHDAGADGRLAVTHVSGRLRLMVKPPGARDELDLALSDVSLVADLADDGQAVVMVELGDVDTARGCYLRPTGGGPALRLGDGAPCDLAADGRGVLALLDGRPPSLAVFPVPAGQPRRLATPGLTGLYWARWCGADRIVLAGAAAGRPPRLWRRDPDATVAPITGEGLYGPGAVSPDGRTVALIAGGRLHVVDAGGRVPPRALDGAFDGETVCGWSIDPAEVLVRTLAPPIGIRRVNVDTAAAAPLLAIDPPPLGRRGVYAVAVTPRGDAYAYSYAQELSRLYTMTTEEPRS